MRDLRRSLLWIDCSAGLTVGVLVLVMSRWLSGLYAMPLAVVVVMGIANVAYGSFSFSLARRAIRPRKLLMALIGANAAWAVLCVVAAFAYARSASAFGLASLVFEGVFVGGLAALEWRNRELLLVVS